MSSPAPDPAAPRPAPGPPEAPAFPERPGGLLSKVAAPLVMYHDPRSLHAEQYRACRTNLAALNRAGGPWAIVVTSSRKGEGKSVTAANLAACLAELPGTRVCLLDTDFRMPSQASLFGQPNEPGLSELLQDRASLKQALRPTVVSGLDVIPSGAEPRSPAELLGGDRFGNLLDELKRRYNWVLIDTPPVHPYTDACVLTPRTNGALLVVRMEATARDLVRRTIASVTAAGGRVIGSFLTGLPTDREDADRVGYYRVDDSGKDVASREREREKHRVEAEKRLREQEQAYLRRQEAAERASRRGDDRQV